MDQDDFDDIADEILELEKIQRKVRIMFGDDSPEESHEADEWQKKWNEKLKEYGDESRRIWRECFDKAIEEAVVESN